MRKLVRIQFTSYTRHSLIPIAIKSIDDFENGHTTFMTFMLGSTLLRRLYFVDYCFNNKTV